MQALSYSPATFGVPGLAPALALVISNVANCAVREAVSLHRIAQLGGRQVIGSGRVLGSQELLSLVDKLRADGVPQEEGARMLPPQVLACGLERLAWYVPGGIRPMYFRCTALEGVLRVPWPTLLFVANGSKLTLAALAHSRRPAPDDKVYRAPLMNHDARSGLCFGSNPVPQDADIDNIPVFEEAVYQSYFTHQNDQHDGPNINWRGSVKRDELVDAKHIAFWQHLDAAKAARFPVRHLVAEPLDVAAFIARHTSAEGR